MYTEGSGRESGLSLKMLKTLSAICFSVPNAMTLLRSGDIRLTGA